MLPLLWLLAPEQGWPSSSWTVTIYSPAYYSKLILALVFFHILACKLQQFKSWSFSALRLLFSVTDWVALGWGTGRCPRAGITALSQLKVSASAIQDSLCLLLRGCLKSLPVPVGIYAGHARACRLERWKTEFENNITGDKTTLLGQRKRSSESLFRCCCRIWLPFSDTDAHYVSGEASSGNGKRAAER